MVGVWTGDLFDIGIYRVVQIYLTPKTPDTEYRTPEDSGHSRFWRTLNLVETKMPRQDLSCHIAGFDKTRNEIRNLVMVLWYQNP